jgi:hypothetical protein
MSSDVDLRRFFNFDESDLVANRKGQVAPKQEKVLRQAGWIGKIISMVLGFSILIWGVYFPGREIVSDYIRFGFNEASLINGAIFILVLTAFAFLFLRGLFEKKKFSVEAVEGKVSFAAVEKKAGSSTSSTATKVRQYEMRVGDENFTVVESLPNIINEGDVYAFYYTGDTRHILSCEFISKGQ